MPDWAPMGVKMLRHNGHFHIKTDKAVDVNLAVPDSETYFPEVSKSVMAGATHSK